jgi:hypothetical protein
MTFPHWTLYAPILLASTLQAETWPLDKVDGTMIIHGEANPAAGALAQSLVQFGHLVVSRPVSIGIVLIPSKPLLSLV